MRIYYCAEAEGQRHHVRTALGVAVDTGGVQVVNVCLDRLFKPLPQAAQLQSRADPVQRLRGRVGHPKRSLRADQWRPRLPQSRVRLPAPGGGPRRPCPALAGRAVHQ